MSGFVTEEYAQVPEGLIASDDPGSLPHDGAILAAAQPSSSRFKMGAVIAPEPPILMGTEPGHMEAAKLEEDDSRIVRGWDIGGDDWSAPSDPLGIITGSPEPESQETSPALDSKDSAAVVQVATSLKQDPTSELLTASVQLNGVSRLELENEGASQESSSGKEVPSIVTLQLKPSMCIQTNNLEPTSPKDSPTASMSSEFKKSQSPHASFRQQRQANKSPGRIPAGEVFRGGPVNGSSAHGGVHGSFNHRSSLEKNREPNGKAWFNHQHSRSHGRLMVSDQRELSLPVSSLDMPPSVGLNPETSQFEPHNPQGDCRYSDAHKAPFLHLQNSGYPMPDYESSGSSVMYLCLCCKNPAF